MKYQLSKVHIFVMSLLILSCASTGPMFQQVNIDDNSNPIIYIYRPNTVCLISAKQQFLVDDNLITLRNNEYAWVSVNTGSHKIISGEFKNLNVPPLITEIYTERGKSYYIKYDISCDSKFLLDNPKFKFTLTEVKEAIAIDELINSHHTTLSIQKR